MRAADDQSGGAIDLEILSIRARGVHGRAGDSFECVGLDRSRPACRARVKDPAIGLGFVRGKRFEKLLAENVGRDFSILKKPLDIATFNIRGRKTEIFSQGDLARVVRASSSVPLMFHPVNIAGRLYWDGGILDKMAFKNVGEDEIILGHYLQSTDKYELYERGRDQKLWMAPKVREKRKVVILKNLARSGPKKMHLGPEILEAAYKQTLERLRSKA